MLITPEYLEQNVLLHAQNPGYGSHGAKHSKEVKIILDKFKTKDLLDYGCGKGAMINDIGGRGYDPAIEKYAGTPEPADVVTCNDVMEHVEIECVDEVIAHVRSLARKAAYFVIALKHAGKKLPDGRNTHITVKSLDWWQKKLKEHFGTVEITRHSEGFEVGFLCF